LPDITTFIIIIHLNMYVDAYFLTHSYTHVGSVS